MAKSMNKRKYENISKNTFLSEYITKTKKIKNKKVKKFHNCSTSLTGTTSPVGNSFGNSFGNSVGNSFGNSFGNSVGNSFSTGTTSTFGNPSRFASKTPIGNSFGFASKTPVGNSFGFASKTPVGNSFSTGTTSTFRNPSRFDSTSTFGNSFGFASKTPFCSKSKCKDTKMVVYQLDSIYSKIHLFRDCHLIQDKNPNKFCLNDKKIKKNVENICKHCWYNYSVANLN